MPPVIQSAGQLEALEDPRPFHFSGPLGAGSIMAYAGRSQSYASIIRTQPNVRTVISFLARNIAQLGVHLFERLSDTDRERVTDHPFALALRNPNPADRRLTTYRLMHRTVWDVASFDVGFWALLDAPPLERPVVVPLRPDRVEVVGSLWPTEFIYHGRRERRSFRPDQIVYFQGSHNLDDPLWGIPPIEALRRIIAEDIAAGEYREQFWARGARFDHVITRPADAPEWKDGARTRFSEDFKSWAGRGPKAGGTPILEDGMTVGKIEGPTAESSQYVEARKLSREEAAALWHVDPIWVGIASQGLAFSSVVERHKALYQDTLGPWVVMLEQDLTFQALPAFEPDPARLDRLYTKLNIAEKLRGSFEERAEAIYKATGRPWLEVNEARALDERNDHPAGDGLALPLAMRVVTDEPSSPPAEPTEPAEPEPAELPAAASKRRGVKAGPTVDQHHAVEAEHREAHRLALERTFSRQLREVLSAHGANSGAGIDDLWDADRWDTELHGDLFGLALDLASAYGTTVADALGFDALDEDRWVAYLDENARIAAETMNTVSRTGVAAALDTLDEDDELEAADAFGAVLGGAGAAARAEQASQSRYTQVAAFVGTEVAGQAGRSQKVWVVTSSKSRHPGMDGEAVPLGGTFSNGLDYPGDPVGGDQSAGCQCMLVFE